MKTKRREQNIHDISPNWVIYRCFSSQAHRAAASRAGHRKSVVPLYSYFCIVNFLGFCRHAKVCKIMSSLEGTIRCATLQDVPAITDIYNHAIVHTTATQDLEPKTMQDREKWFLAHDPVKLPVFVYEVQNEVLGWAALTLFSERAGYHLCVENAIYLAPKATGKGIGMKLLLHLIQVAREQGYHTIIARMAAENAASRALHSKAGFELAGILKEAGHKFGRHIDIAFMQLIL